MFIVLNDLLIVIIFLCGIAYLKYMNKLAVSEISEDMYHCSDFALMMTKLPKHDNLI